MVVVIGGGGFSGLVVAGYVDLLEKDRDRDREREMGEKREKCVVYII